MKNKILIIQIVMFIAIAVLYYLHFSTSSGENEASLPQVSEKTKEKASEVPRIAYINVDTLLNNYQFYKDLIAKLEQKERSIAADLQAKQQSLQREAISFQEKVQKGLFLSQQSAEKEQAAIMKKQQDLEQRQANLSNSFLEEKQKLNKQLNDTVINYVKEFNKKYKFTYILTNTSNDNFLYADESLDLTKVLLDGLNERYKNNIKK